MRFSFLQLAEYQQGGQIELTTIIILCAAFYSALQYVNGLLKSRNFLFQLTNSSLEFVILLFGCVPNLTTIVSHG